MRNDKEGKNYGRGYEKMRIQRSRSTNMKKICRYSTQNLKQQKMTHKYTCVIYVVTNDHMIDNANGVDYDQLPCGNLNRT